LKSNSLANKFLEITNDIHLGLKFGSCNAENRKIKSPLLAPLLAGKNLKQITGSVKTPGGLNLTRGLRSG